MWIKDGDVKGKVFGDWVYDTLCEGTEQWVDHNGKSLSKEYKCHEEHQLQHHQLDEN